MIAKTRPMEEVQPIERNGRALGICVTCNDVDICTSRATWEGPVFWCEQFDDHTEPPGYALRDVDPVDSDVSALAEPLPGVRGLCVNCAHRADCCLPRPEGGVWHCEEYE